jgi:hypothetical protein
MSVRLCQLKEQTSKAGRRYLSGLLGDLRVHVFQCQADPTTWNVLLRHERKKKPAAEAPAGEDSGGGE